MHIAHISGPQCIYQICRGLLLSCHTSYGNTVLDPMKIVHVVGEIWQFPLIIRLYTELKRKKSNLNRNNNTDRCSQLARSTFLLLFVTGYIYIFDVFIDCILNSPDSRKPRTKTVEATRQGRRTRIFQEVLSLKPIQFVAMANKGEKGIPKLALKVQDYSQESLYLKLFQNTRFFKGHRHSVILPLLKYCSASGIWNTHPKYKKACTKVEGTESPVVLKSTKTKNWRDLIRLDVV